MTDDQTKATVQDQTTPTTPPSPEEHADIPWMVTQADGTPGGTPTDEEREIVTKAHALLQADPHFQALPSPALSRVEMNRGVPCSESGCLYLRYEVPGQTPQEFWPHWGKADKVSWKSGQVSVQQAKA
ncbi:hypothetical protein [Deinococcus aquiradiocola]|uniref:Uncharacterized protein n=1 Tax=Deinococcus aquiradiocola TaxID=393059 RepID=A0A917PP95_9DEIO|nr:hypothetical protein [Deinococcus aquiradiocola]GGJ86942.1 hypothetical protein GCM10008939_33680 [Deinococcus aquiradiocola]